MWARVQLLRRQGARLEEAELDPPVEGELTIAFEESKRPGRPPIRVANLRAPPVGTQRFERGLLLPLFDARVMSLEGDVLRITGTELGHVDGRTSEHVQIWRCTFVQRPQGEPSAAGINAS